MGDDVSCDEATRQAMSEPNLLSHEVIKIIHSEGARYKHPGDEGLAYVKDVIGQALTSLELDMASATVTDFRILFHKHWEKILEHLVPSEAHERVTDKFKGLIF